MEIRADIIDYMGKYEEGVVVLLNLSVGDKFYEGTLFYSEKDIVLTPDNRIEESIGCNIEEWSGYRDLMESILKRLVPIDEIIVRLDDVDFEKYLSYYEDDFNNFVLDEIDPNEIITGTNSNLE